MANRRLRGGIFAGLVVLAAFAVMAPVPASPSSMTGLSGGAAGGANSARPIMLAQQSDKKKASPNDASGKTTTKSDDLYRPRCGAYARTNRCNARWDIRSGSCVC